MNSITSHPRFDSDFSRLDTVEDICRAAVKWGLALDLRALLSKDWASSHAHLPRLTRDICYEPADATQIR